MVAKLAQVPYSCNRRFCRRFLPANFFKRAHMYRVRARNARIRAMRRTHLIGTRNNEAAQPRTIAITV